jgi:hypothetical protein
MSAAPRTARAADLELAVVHHLAADRRAVVLAGVLLVELELGDRRADVGRAADRAPRTSADLELGAACTTSPRTPRSARSAPPRRRSPGSYSPACSWSSSSSATAALMSAAPRTARAADPPRTSSSARSAPRDLTCPRVLRPERSPMPTQVTDARDAQPSSNVSPPAYRARHARSEGFQRGTGRHRVEATEAAVSLLQTLAGALGPRRASPRWRPRQQTHVKPAPRLCRLPPQLLSRRARRLAQADQLSGPPRACIHRDWPPLQLRGLRSVHVTLQGLHHRDSETVRADLLVLRVSCSYCA